MKVTIFNPALKQLLIKYGHDNRETWQSIRNHDGSVQHLEFLSELEKEVFKTFEEIDAYEVIDQAAARQAFIDQSQSLNLMINPKMSAKEINELYLAAWRSRVKSLYYQHPLTPPKKFNQNKLCGVACEA